MKNVSRMTKDEFHDYMRRIKFQYDDREGMSQNNSDHQSDPISWPPFDSTVVAFHHISKEEYLRASIEAPRIWGKEQNRHFLKSVLHTHRTCTIRHFTLPAYSAYWDFGKCGYLTADRHLTIPEFQAITSVDVLSGEWISRSLRV